MHKVSFIFTVFMYIRANVITETWSFKFGWFLTRYYYLARNYIIFHDHMVLIRYFVLSADMQIKQFQDFRLLCKVRKSKSK